MAIRQYICPIGSRPWAIKTSHVSNLIVACMLCNLEYFSSVYIEMIQHLAGWEALWNRHIPRSQGLGTFQRSWWGGCQCQVQGVHGPFGCIFVYRQLYRTYKNYYQPHWPTIVLNIKYTGACLMRQGKFHQNYLHFITRLAYNLYNHVYPPCRERPPVQGDHIIQWPLYTGFTVVT